MFSLEGATFAAYRSGLRTLQSVGTDVIVFISPKANYLTAGPADAALLQGFFDAAAQKIHALGIPVVQMNSQRYSLAEFQNTWGLLSEEEGAPRFSRALADAVAAVLAGRAPDPEIARVLPRAPDGDSSGALAYWKPHRPGAD
jgi:hypothetical protein